MSCHGHLVCVAQCTLETGQHGYQVPYNRRIYSGEVYVGTDFRGSPKPTWIMSLSAGLKFNDKMRTVRDNSITISKAIVYSPECIEHVLYLMRDDKEYTGPC